MTKEASTIDPTVRFQGLDGKQSVVRDFQPGPRQTVDFVIFEPYGPGRLVWDNGPAMFLPTVGSPVPLIDVGIPGYERNEAGDWVCKRPVHTVQGTFIVDVLTKGEAHYREFSPELGIGWMVTARVVQDITGHTLLGSIYRFDADSGTSIEFQVTDLSLGRPDRLLSDDPDEVNWTTYTLQDGSKVPFRRGGPPPERAP